MIFFSEDSLEERIFAYFNDVQEPDIDMSDLNNAVYTLNERTLWPDETSESYTIFVWKVVEKLRKERFPEEFKM